MKPSGLKFGANLEIHFHDQDRASIIMETTRGMDQKFGELSLFSAFLCRQLANLGRGQIGDSLAQLLIGSSSNIKLLKEYKSSTGASLVDYLGFPGRKRYEAQLRTSSTVSQ